MREIVHLQTGQVSHFVTFNMHTTYIPSSSAATKSVCGLVLHHQTVTNVPQVPSFGKSSRMSTALSAMVFTRAIMTSNLRGSAYIIMRPEVHVCNFCFSSSSCSDTLRVAGGLDSQQVCSPCSPNRSRTGDHGLGSLRATRESVPPRQLCFWSKRRRQQLG